MGRWGPLIEHDGAEPLPLIRTIGQILVDFHFSTDGIGHIIPEQSDVISPAWPGFYWRWERRGLIFRRRMRVCDEPDYRPIIRYRIWQDLDQVEALRRLAQDTSTPITGPEHQPKPVREKSPDVRPRPQKAPT